MVKHMKCRTVDCQLGAMYQFEQEKPNAALNEELQ